jgi:hypothetical protein
MPDATWHSSPGRAGRRSLVWAVGCEFKTAVSEFGKYLLESVAGRAAEVSSPSSRRYSSATKWTRGVASTRVLGPDPKTERTEAMSSLPESTRTENDYFAIVVKVSGYPEFVDGFGHNWKEACDTDLP